MRLVFVDTSAWIALGSKDDQYHPPAESFFRQLVSERAKLVTSDFVLDETYTGLSRMVTAESINSFNLWISSSIEKEKLILERVEPRIFAEAWNVFMRYYEHGPSFTDCTSIVIANKIKVDCAFTFDHHFPTMGMEAQPYTPPRKRARAGKPSGQ